MGSSARKVVVACATFKGTLSSKAAGEALSRGLQSLGISTQVAALADGGEGLVEALASQVSGALMVGAACRGPMQTPRTATLAILPVAPPSDGIQCSSLRKHKLAVIEMAASSGLGLVPAGQRDPKEATSLGVGDQILGAFEHLTDDMEILLGLGGSATNDGGAGMAQALGAKLLDKNDKPIEPGGAPLLKLARIDVSEMDKRLKKVHVTVACDVNNPLCGPQGASAVFGPQKGATPDDVRILDAALAHFAEIIKRDLGKDVLNVPGAGAAGGMGAGCLAFLDAKLKPGIELVLDAIDFNRMLTGASLVITGEGMLDDQTLMGKAPAGVAQRAAQRGLPCIAVGGGIDARHVAALRKTFSRIESLSEFAGSVDAAMHEPARWLENMAKARAAEWLA